MTSPGPIHLSTSFSALLESYRDYLQGTTSYASFLDAVQRLPQDFRASTTISAARSDMAVQNHSSTSVSALESRPPIR